MFGWWSDMSDHRLHIKYLVLLTGYLILHRVTPPVVMGTHVPIHKLTEALTRLLIRGISSLEISKYLFGSI